MKNVAIRVDASVRIGTGHFMRCLTLATEIVLRGGGVRFLSRELPEHLRNLLSVNGIEYMGLPESNVMPNGDLVHSDWLGTSQEMDAEQTEAALSGLQWDYLIVDHYAIDERWESMLKRVVGKLIVIDDLADRPHECDVLLDQNLYEDMYHRYDKLVPPSCEQLIGPRYALLRREFEQSRAQATARAETVKRILIFFGGMDAANYTAMAIRSIIEAGLDQVAVDVVIGATHPELEAIKVLCHKHGFDCHVQTDRIAALMAEADLSIGAGGTVMWERCALGLPTIVVCTAHNQRVQIDCAGSRLLIYVPELTDKDWTAELATHVRALVFNPVLRRALSENGLATVDGRGTQRVLDRLDFDQVTMRLAVLSDSENLYQWRNNPAIRNVSRRSAPIAREQHDDWLESVLQDKNRVLLIAMLRNEPIGVVRFDIKGEQAEISIYNVPGAKSSGKGHLVLKNAEAWMRTHRRDVTQFHAEVLGENERSHRLFTSAKYALESTTYIKKVALTNE